MSAQDAAAFCAPNLAALRSYLAPASLAAVLVEAVEGAPTEQDAAGRLAAVVEERLSAVRAALDA